MQNFIWKPNYSVNAFVIKKLTLWGQRDPSAFMSSSCSCKGLRMSSQKQQGSQPSVTPCLEDPAPSPGLCEHQV